MISGGKLIPERTLQAVNSQSLLPKKEKERGKEKEKEKERGKEKEKERGKEKEKEKEKEKIKDTKQVRSG